jgi:uncharacterized membrane protein YidH (DUF202 family)
MGLGSSILLIAAGAILRFAVTAHVKDVNLHRVGVILMIVGIAGLVIAVLAMTVLEDRRRRALYDDRVPPGPPAP